GTKKSLDKAEAVDKDEVEDAAADNNSPSAKYRWADWNVGYPKGTIKPNDLTRHGYVLMTVMGNYYKNILSAERNQPQFDCGQLFVYADVDQRTLGTAHALIAGLCGKPSAVTIFHEVNPKQKDPLFNATDWASQPKDYGRDPDNPKEYKIVPEMSTDAIHLSAKNDPNLPTQTFKPQLLQFQALLDKRCKQGCEPLAGVKAEFKDASKPNVPLASLSGPVDTGRTWSEDIFLEYAQCGDITNPFDASQLGQPNGTPSSGDLEELQKGLEVHVGGYRINGRDDFMNNAP